jgi:hypothetical protein
MSGWTDIKIDSELLRLEAQRAFGIKSSGYAFIQHSALTMIEWVHQMEPAQ